MNKVHISSGKRDEERELGVGDQRALKLIFLLFSRIANVEIDPDVDQEAGLG